MTAKLKKTSKKELKEDQFVSTVVTAEEWVELYWKQILMVIGGIAVVIVIVLFYQQKIEQENVEAAGKIAKVMPLYDQGSYVEAANGREGTDIEGFKKIADEFGGVEQGEIAKIYAANSLYFNGQYKEALDYYSDYSSSDFLFKATALAGEAACYNALKDYSLAADKYFEAATISKANVSNPVYLLNAGINYIKAGKNESARNAFEKISTDYAGTTETREAKNYLATLD